MKRDSTSAEVDVRAIDVGYFNTKYTLGERTGNEIKAAMFQSLAPRQETSRGVENETKTTADGCWVSIAGVNYFVGRGSSPEGAVSGRPC